MTTLASTSDCTTSTSCAKHFGWDRSGPSEWLPRSPDVPAIAGPPPAHPFLVLDCNEFSVWCRACLWRSPGCATVAEAREAFTAHVCPAAPAWSAAVRWRLLLSELAAVRVRRCFCCARIGVRQFRAANDAMPRTWARTWVCADRPVCRRRQAAQAARWERGWRRRRLA